MLLLLLFLISVNAQCPLVPPSKYIAECTEQSNLREYFVSGTHYQVGFQTGQQLGSQIRNYVYSQTSYCVNTAESLGWVQEIADPNTSYAKLFRKLKRHAREYYPQYYEEYEGLADGSGVPLDTLLALSFQDELYVEYIRSVAPQSLKEKADGCSNFFYQDASGHIVYGHNEDGDPTMDRGMVTLHISLKDPFYNSYYNYTIGGYYLGMLASWTFGFNSYGMVIDMNSVYPLAPDVGQGTSWSSRDVFSAKNMADAIAKAAPSESTLGASFNIGSLKEQVWINLEGGPSGLKKITNHTASVGQEYFFHHFNDYLRNNMYYHRSSSSKHREVNLARLVEVNGHPSTVEKMAAYLGDTTDDYTAIDGDTFVYWRRDPNLDYAFTHATVIGFSNLDHSFTYRVYGTGVNPKDCPNIYKEYIVRATQ